ncbi:MAG: hypothetical protein SX243_24455 [Acidobacteriota bacterium]|nr:hypothetical protein [Acidobacteriota bacterium]
MARDLGQLERFVEETAGLVGGRRERELGELAERVRRAGERWGVV